MKKLLSLLTLILLASFMLVGCNKSTNPTTTENVTTNPPTTTEEGNKYLESVKILAIGNSFSVDSMEYMYSILKDLGCNKVVLGNMFIAGCSLATHGNNARSGAEAYTYYKNTTGEWKTTNNIALVDGIIDEKWDFIVMQQVSGLSGVASSYDVGYSQVYDLIKESATNENVRLCWNMTWAYQRNSNHPDFPTYQNDQDIMYDQIVSAVKKKILPKEEIEIVIPTGTAIQNIRAGFIGDTVTRDTYHLSLTTGRYIAGLTWVKAITGLDISSVSYNPSKSEINSEKLREIIRCVNASIINPFEVTYVE